MSPDSKAQTPQAKTSGGLLGRIFGRGGHENSGADAHSGKPTRSTLDLARYSGFHPPRLQDADGAAFLIDG